VSTIAQGRGAGTASSRLSAYGAISLDRIGQRLDSGLPLVKVAPPFTSTAPAADHPTDPAGPPADHADPPATRP